MNCFLSNEKATIALAKSFARLLPTPMILGFQGEIGAGKTTFIRALLKALKISGPIKSPSFSLIESYSLPPLIIHHIDLYRIADESELEYLGFRELFKNALVLIEWPEKGGQSVPMPDIAFQFHFEHQGRLLSMSANTPLGQSLLSSLAESL